jgi:hypothetical protein
MCNAMPRSESMEAVVQEKRYMPQCNSGDTMGVSYVNGVSTNLSRTFALFSALFKSFRKRAMPIRISDPYG